VAALRGTRERRESANEIGGGKRDVKYALNMLLFLATAWMLWSGHLEPFIVLLGAVSCLIVLFFSGRMGILDSEGVPLWLGIRPLTHYSPWLFKEVIKSNLDVTKRILSRPMRIEPAMTDVPATQRTELGQVIFANSITLTPGTLSVDIQAGIIRVHWLAAPAEGEDMTSEMGRRVCRLEGEG
jgi:multicomponent Na+:H+ antiporter subunit E